jgi:hypothetical protein
MRSLTGRGIRDCNEVNKCRKEKYIKINDGNISFTYCRSMSIINILRATYTQTPMTLHKLSKQRLHKMMFGKRTTAPKQNTGKLEINFNIFLFFEV